MAVRTLWRIKHSVSTRTAKNSLFCCKVFSLRNPAICPVNGSCELWELRKWTCFYFLNLFIWAECLPLASWSFNGAFFRLKILSRTLINSVSLELSYSYELINPALWLPFLPSNLTRNPIVHLLNLATLGPASLLSDWWKRGPLTEGLMASLTLSTSAHPLSSDFSRATQAFPILWEATAFLGS